MATPIENIDKNIQRFVREAVDKESKTDEIIEDVAENIEDVTEEIRERGKGFMKIFGSVKGIFGSIKNVLGNIKGHFENLFGSISGHVREVLGPVSEAFDVVKGLFWNVVGILKDVKNYIFIAASFIPKVWKNVTGFISRWWKKDEREGGKTKRRVAGFIGALMAIMGIAIGALLGIVGKPLTAAAKLFGVPLKILSTVLEKLPIIGKFFKKTSSFLAKIGKYFKGLVVTLKKIPILGKFIKGIGMGFKKLGWPLILLFALIDAIKAWYTTEGTKVDKIKSLLTAVFNSIFELPLKILGWIPKKVLEWMGIEFDPAQYIMDMWSKITGFIVDQMVSVFQDPRKYFTDIYTKITDRFNEATSWMSDTVSNIIGKIESIFTSIDNFFSNVGLFIKNIFSWDTIKSLLSLTADPAEIIANTWEQSKIEGAINKNTQAKAAKETDQIEQQKQVQEGLNKVGQDILKAFENQKNVNNIATIPGTGYHGSGRKDIVKENENYMMGIQNMIQ